MKRIIAAAAFVAVVAFGAAACGTDHGSTTSADSGVNTHTFDPHTTETVPPTGSDALDGYTWDSPEIRAIVVNAFSPSKWDQACVNTHLRSTYPTPSAFSHDYDTIGAVAVTSKTGVVACYLGGSS